jgi:hypothetical protein
MHDDVDGILPQDAEIDLGTYRLGRVEQDVLNFSGDHGTAPAVGQGCADSMAEDVLRVLVVADVIVDMMKKLDLKYPPAPEKLTEIRNQLEAGEFEPAN